MASTEQVANEHLLVHARARHGDEALTLALNLGDEPYALTRGSSVLAAEPAVIADAVPPHGWAVLEG